MNTKCNCCGGMMPDRETLDTNRDQADECTGSVDDQGRCRAWSNDALWDSDQDKDMPSQFELDCGGFGD